jgi:tripartite-type tricarboxylate transporter receptor subunit TctC
MGSAVLGSALPHIRSGRVRAIGVSGAQRSPQLRDVPTIAEQGLGGYAFEPFYAIVVPARTPREIMGALADAIAKSMSTPEFREQFVKIVGSDVVVNTPEQMLQVAKKEAELIDKIARAANIKEE